MTLDDLARTHGLSNDEADKLARFDALFTETAAHTNLVSRATLPDRWTRHYADSLQLWPLIPAGADTILDVGAGAGFPGLPLAILAEGRAPYRRFTLSDSVGKKAAFMASVIEALGLTNAAATNARAETLPDRYGVVMARAVTALPKLLDLCVPRLAPGGTLILPKGARAEEELAAARERWQMEASLVQSQTDADARILVVTRPERRA